MLGDNTSNSKPNKWRGASTSSVLIFDNIEDDEDEDEDEDPCSAILIFLIAHKIKIVSFFSGLVTNGSVSS